MAEDSSDSQEKTALYDETPSYIPKRFREDKYHVRNERELEKIFNKSMANFQCEYDILTIRKVDYKEQLLFLPREDSSIHGRKRR